MIKSGKIYTSVSIAALAAMSGTIPAFAQSTGSVDFENVIIVTGTNLPKTVEGVSIPDTPKAKQVLTQEVIARQNPGQSILDTINLIPGVTFTNNDAYGSSGGQLNIRGFSEDRISLTFDGVPLNDSGNYAIYSNQQLDPELIEEVNVNLGTTDVDSPTASATGSTVNYRTIVPGKDLGATLAASVGEDNFYRVFGVLETGDITGFGTRAFVSASKATNDNPFNNYGKVDKQQYNARIYQEIGSNGDFVSIAGHYNQNRNNFFGSLPLRYDDAVPSGFPQDTDERKYTINYPCQVVSGGPGPQDARDDKCGTEFDRRFNPSNTGNVRVNSRFTLAQDLVLTVDGAYQYVKANGGGTSRGNEGTRNVGGTELTGFISGSPYFGRDINGDGDTEDTVNVLSPSQTRTRRYSAVASLRWNINDDHTVRIAYTHDYANHRQTGQVGLLKSNGEPVDVFPINDPQIDVTGAVLQKRDRQSFAILDQVSGEYRGEFADGKLVVVAGLRAPFFKRDLNNYCFTTSETGFVDCFGRDDPRNAVYAAANPTVQGPQQRVLKYDDILPNAGVVYKVMDKVSLFANYSRGIQVPGTDSLYNAFFFAPDTASARPEPETTDNFDLGARYRSSKVQAQLSVWYTKYKNRLASAYDPVTEKSVYRNLGAVDKYGIDGSVAYQPLEQLTFYAFGSYMKSKIKDDVQAGTCTATDVTNSNAGCVTVGDPIFVATAGNRESGAPSYSFGGSVRGNLGPVELGLTAKRTGGKYIYDTNLPIYGSALEEIFPAKTPAYWLVNLDARFSFADFGLEKTYVQLNVYNLFDELYVGRYTSGLNQGNVLGAGVVTGTPGSAPFAQIGAPRTVSASLVVGF